MKTTLQKSILYVIPGIMFIVLSGCYTELGTVKNDRDGDEESYTSSQSGNDNENETTVDNDDSTYEYNGTMTASYEDNQYGGSWYPRYHYGFNYYYPSYYWPSVAFSVAYSDPWCYDYAWYYDPWWCGTSYVSYPHYGYYPYYRHGYVYDATPAHRSTRDFGSTRSGSSRGTTDGRSGVPTVERNTNDLPVGAVRQGASSGHRADKATTSSSNRQSGNKRGYKPKANTRSSRGEYGVRGSSSRGGDARREGRRDTRPQYRPHEGNSLPPSYGGVTPSGPRDNAGQREPSRAPRDAGSSRSGNNNPPPPPSTHAPSSPPPSSGGQAPSNGGARGGSSRKP